ncbi:MAG: MBG domain-containing protein, partial [Bacteroidota bacterium]|nr:MBG domain-containing protein [Bacteroidota bacterium]
MKTQVYSSSPKRKLTFLISFLVILFCALCSTTLYAQDQEAYVETDAPDYAPGSTVLIAGEYWTPGETVYLKVTHLSPLPVPDATGVTPNPYNAWTVIADANGEVHATWYVNDFELGAQLQLEAYTASGYDYRTFFTDAANTNTTISYSPTSNVKYGDEMTFTINVKVGSNGVTSGTLNLLDGSTIIKTVVFSSTTTGLNYIYKISSLSASSHNIKADYTGDSNFKSSNATSGNFTINKKAATVIADAKAKTYGDDNPSLTAVVSGTVNGDALNYTLATTAGKFSSVGTYPIAITLGSNPNYSITPTDALLTVGQKAATV